MKQVVRIAVFTLVALLVCSSSMAQYAYQPLGENPFQTEIEQVQVSDPMALTKGQKWTDAGRGVLFTGLASALTILSLDVYGAVVRGEGATMPTLMAGYAAFYSALASLPFYLVGHYYKTDSSRPIIFEGDKIGPANFLTLGCGIGNLLSVDYVRGYYVTNNVFLGGGVGLGLWEMVDIFKYDTFLYSLPIYANARISLGAKRVTPYFSGSFGYDIPCQSLYTGVEFGTRIRRVKSDAGTSLWIGFKSEFRGADASNFGIKCGWSF
ncbi:MAG: hypothetical protein IKK02_04640 [Tidjanibacter sp.]|nr:hypothetical protein [Alistipes sp.]MBR4064529.1 hypothetical protein [Tidjanibacter sp.]